MVVMLQLSSHRYAGKQGGTRSGDKMRRTLAPEMRPRGEQALPDAGIADSTIIHSEDIGLWMSSASRTEIRQQRRAINAASADHS